MPSTDPSSIDFASLSTLCLVHAKKSFSGAAEQLGITQSTVSYTVDRMRAAFDDPLFVRQGGRIVATPRCEELVVEARLILEQYNKMVHAEEFEPATAKGTLRISSNYYERSIILPRLIRDVRKHAPGVHLMMISAQRDGAGQLQRGEADVLLSPSNISLNGVYSKQLLKDRYVCVMDQSNRMADGDFTEEMFREANHAFVSFAEIWRSDYAVGMRRKGLDVNRALSISGPENIGVLLDGTDMIAAVPRRIALKDASHLAMRECPFHVPFQVSMYWTARTNRSKMHVWLRNLIAELSVQATQK
ncbi:MAG: LysR substrate-binding domain-containing protein [Roseovarius sp.]